MLRTIGHVLLVVIALNASVFAQLRKVDMTDFDAFFDRVMKESGIVGGGLVLLQDNQIIDQRFHGLANLELGQAVSADTIFHWASITKTFTAIAIMQLRDRGLLNLDDPIVKYVPELAQVHNRFGPMNKITLRHLLSHTAGFRDPTWPWGGDEPWKPAEPTRWEQLVAMMPYTEILFEPGSKYSYSNPGIIFLGRVIELLSHDDYEVYVDKNILKPLEMHRSYFDSTPYHLLKYRSHSYQLIEGKLTPGRFDMDTGITVSNGGLNSPLSDMVKYLNFLIGDPKRKDIYEAVLSRSSLEEMWKPAAVLPEEKNGQARRDQIGLGFFIEDNFGMHFVGHSGHQNYFATHFYVNPALRAAYIVAFNTYAPPKQKNPAHDTDLVDLKIKDYLFEKVFSKLKGR